MPAKRKDQVLINRNFLMILFALIIILIIVTAVLLGVVVSDKRSSGEKEPIKIENENIPEEGTTSAPVAALPAGLGNYRVNTTASALNLRAQANTDGEILTEIPKGSLINITALNGEWGYTSYGSYSGWVKMSYLIPADAAPVLTSASANPAG